MSENEQLQSINKEATRLKAWYDMAQEGAKNTELAAQKLVDDKTKAGKAIGHRTIQALKSHEQTISEFEDIARSREKQSRDHYLQNKAEYHELAREDAEANGVRINMSQTPEDAQVIEVNFQKK